MNPGAQKKYDKDCYTYERRTFELKNAEHFNDISAAIAREKQLKGWSGKKKQSLFREDWIEINRLSRSSTKK